ncbi:MAG: hypothetical protein HPY55_16030 [Firmicutes bacterium]|nr:hypothetical protein [Bacillota bacterium]
MRSDENLLSYKELPGEDMQQKELSEIARILSQKPELASALLAVAVALTEVTYGEVIVKMQGGKPVWVDKIERERLG